MWCGVAAFGVVWREYPGRVSEGVAPRLRDFALSGRSMIIVYMIIRSVAPGTSTEGVATG